MKQFSIHLQWRVLTLMLGLLLAAGCGKSESQSSSSSSGNSGSADYTIGGISGYGDKEAVAAVCAELARHWVKTPDGWVSEFPAKTYMATGQRAGPESFYREMKDLKFAVSPNDLSESDKLNGVQFSGSCRFDQTPFRIYGDPNAFGPAKWSDWNDSNPSLNIEKKKGQWTFTGITGSLVNGTVPTAATIAQLK